MEALLLARSWKISVLKRDGSIEPFDRLKLRGCLLRALPSCGEEYYLAEALSAAIECYLHRIGRRCVSSAALLEMALEALCSANQDPSARRLEHRHRRRLAMRNALHIRHGQARTAWSKQWLAQLASARWELSRPAARIVAGDVEEHLLTHPRRHLSRRQALLLLDEAMSAYGLAETATAAASIR
jgi:hypothetical protein